MTVAKAFAVAIALVGGSVPLCGRVLAFQQSPIRQQASVNVEITDIRSTRGQVVIQLWDTAEGFPKNPDIRLHPLQIPATQSINGHLQATLTVSPGIHAITVWHDENGNGKFDTNLVGIPKEGYGASNNPVTHFHAPSFDQAKFDAASSGCRLVIAMHY
jgi:uncharacterized protein (DUF2141 family)